MPIATLLLREDSTTSLSSLVEKSQQQKKFSSSPEYDIQLNNCQLDLVLTSSPPPRPPCKISSTSTDEGFESDIDSLSIVSSDDSFTSGNSPENSGSKPTAETDSANGSASSDSDTDSPPPNNLPEINKNDLINKIESFNLVDCICYTDVKFPDILVFVIKQEALVFKFDNINILQNFYTNFTTLKAVTNQKAYGKNVEAKFNLLQRTDVNGVTHIEITREPETNKIVPDTGPSSIISLNTPETQELRKFDLKERSKTLNTRQRFETNRFSTLKVSKSSSTDNILDLDDNLVNKNKESKAEKTASLRKVWNSAESLLDTPKRPERKKKLKPKAPQPPEKSDVFSGQYVRVNVNFDISKTDSNRLIIKSHCNEPHPKKLQNFSLLTSKPNLSSFLKPKPQIIKYETAVKKIESSTLNRPKVESNSWTNSVPRLLKKPRSRSETRNFTPMAYRYIDTTQTYPPVTYSVQPTTPRLTSNIHGPPNYSHQPSISFAMTNSQNIGNRLFGLSPKLRDFNSDLINSKNEGGRWGGSEIGVSTNNNNSKAGNLKSVIKKDENKKKNEKKVTFSAYTTVQVV